MVESQYTKSQYNTINSIVKMVEPILMIDELTYLPVHGGVGFYEAELKTLANQEITTEGNIMETLESIDQGIIEVMPVKLQQKLTHREMFQSTSSQSLRLLIMISYRRLLMKLTKFIQIVISNHLSKSKDQNFSNIIILAISIRGQHDNI